MSSIVFFPPRGLEQKQMRLEIRGMTPLLQVFDMPTSLEFYRKLGFEVVGDSGQGDRSGWVMLQLSDVLLMLNTQYEDEDRPIAPNDARTDAHGDTCLYFSCPDVNAAFDFLTKQGVQVAGIPKIAPYGMLQLYLRDPDNYNVCFQWPSGNNVS